MNAARRHRLLGNLPFSLTLLGLIVLTVAVVNLLSQRSGGAQQAIDGLYLLRTATDRQVERIQERLTLHPQDAGAYVRLGEAYLQKARETGDPSYYTRSEGALLRALELDPDSASAMTTMGAIALGRHQFHEAIQWAQRSLALNPNIADTYGVLGDAQVELGQYEAAFETYQTMVDFKPGFASYARVSHARELVGDVDGAVEAMQMAVAAGLPGTEASAWARVQLGNLYFNMRRLDEAAKQYEAALLDFPGYYLALAELGRVRAAGGRYEEAIDLYERSIAVIPQIGTLAALGDLYMITGEPDKARLQYGTVDVIAALSEADGVVNSRELAVFYADHGINVSKALDLASQEFEVRKDIYGYDALAWTLYRNGKYDEAVQAIQQAMRLGTKDASIYYHAGMIYHALGHRAKAREHLERAFAINPHLSLLQAEHARQVLGEIEGDSK